MLLYLHFFSQQECAPSGALVRYSSPRIRHCRGTFKEVFVRLFEAAISGGGINRSGTGVSRYGRGFDDLSSNRLPVARL